MHGFKPIPDEEGTETQRPESRESNITSRFKPIPDEEGTETENLRTNSFAYT